MADQSAWIEHFGEQEIMLWGCCYTRTDQSEQVREKRQQQQLTQLHYTNLASPKKTDDSGTSESYSVYFICLHKTSMRILCSEVQIQMIFSFAIAWVRLIVLHNGLELFKKCEIKLNRRKRMKRRRNNGTSIEIDELNILTENYHCQLDNIQTHTYHLDFYVLL